MMKRLFTLITATIIAFFFIGCSDNSVSDNSDIFDTGNEIPFQELYDQRIDRYLGSFSPTDSEVVAAGTTEYFFSGENAPMCYTGDQFSMTTRDGNNNNLLIFLQGGGFCGPFGCEALETGIPLIPFGMLNPFEPLNPVSGFDLGYVPYCDGSMMMGDNEIDSDGDGVNDRFFRGLQNLSASLDVISKAYPAPERIVLAGNSAGGSAVHAALPLVRKLYPEVQINVINDSGLGIASPGGMASLFDYWNAGSFMPASCTNCIGTDGNLTDFHRYQLSEDENIRMAYISSKQDSVTSFAVGGPAFEQQLLEAASELNAAYPDRFHSLIDNGEAHTYLIRRFDGIVGATTVRDWIDDMISASSDWTSILE